MPWPVGVTNHGSTCYLNSLLQYCFSIKRDLNFSSVKRWKLTLRLKRLRVILDEGTLLKYIRTDCYSTGGFEIPQEADEEVAGERERF
ncbi:unnamed protein product [Zymoseptoria tritici ST99CH_1A5]|uniref:Uncharacterized protein n=1 Tax=Zymoseptoria tritici ST99CH_1A5 TaxID=1276529 RepID=A0A1Y6M0W1_ZYMTR|nr:unnamed protein product [Zymoseptoria tritici ST99CH_1A5]